MASKKKKTDSPKSERTFQYLEKVFRAHRAGKIDNARLRAEVWEAQFSGATREQIQQIRERLNYYPQAGVSRSDSSLSGTHHEHVEQATFDLKRLTRAKVEQTPCSSVGDLLFNAGRIMAHANMADDGSPTGRKLFAMAAARRDQVFAKAAACGMRAPVRR